MNLRNMAAALVLAMGAASASTIVAARTDVEVNIGIAPPPVIVEPIPPPRVGYTWAPGYWHWNGHKHVWHKGYYLRERPGYVWAPHHWEQRGDRWYFEGGRWEPRA